jgi:hypothetical protein
MSLIEEPAPRQRTARRALGSADRRASWLAAAAWALSTASLIGFPGPDSFFMGAAPLVATASVFPALMAMWMQRYRGGFSRAFLVGGAVALFALGAAYAGRASTARVFVACFVPAVLSIVAAMTLSAARRARAI